MSTFHGPPLAAAQWAGSLTIGGLLREVAQRNGDHEAVVFRDAGEVETRWSYRELEVQAHAVAKALVAAGVTRGSHVGILMPNRPEWLAAFFGIALSGCVAVPLSTFATVRELGFMLRHADVAALITQRTLLKHNYLDNLLELCPELASAPAGRLYSTELPELRQVICLGLEAGYGAVQPWELFMADKVRVPESLTHALAATVHPSDRALILFTSGSTSRPKAILHSHRAVALQCWRWVELLRIDPQERRWTAYPLFWAAGLTMAMGGTLAGGGCLILQETFEPGGVLGLIERERVTSTSAHVHQLAQLEMHPHWASADLSSLRRIEPHKPLARHPTVQPDPEWIEPSAYGLTETLTAFTALTWEVPMELRDQSKGRVLEGNSLRILDDAGRPLPAGESGEIAVKGATLMQGYLKRMPEEVFDSDGFYHTGDSGRVDEEGNLHFLGRRNALIKSGGALVSPAEVDEALMEHPGLELARTLGVPHPTLGELVVVCAVVNGLVPVDEQGVQEYLRERLASYKVPRRVLFLDEDDVPWTDNEKVRLEDLRALVAARLGDGDAEAE